MKLFNRFVKALISVLFITSFTNSLFAQTDTALFEKIENSGSVPYNEIKDNAKLQEQYGKQQYAAHRKIHITPIPRLISTIR